MATRFYAIGPAGKLADVVEGVGAAASSALINLTIDLTATGVTGAGNVARTISRAEVLLALETLAGYIIADQWPPA